jgi:putative oxidoreductase
MVDFSSKLPRVLVTRPILSLTVLRLLIGLIFVKEGTGKLLGWFEHGGPEITAAFFNEIGIPLPAFSAVFVGVVETVCGGCLMAGFLTRIVVVPIAVVMVTAIVTVHASVGFAYPLLLCASFFVLGQSGGGSYSVDAYINERRTFSPVLTPYTKLRHRG